jgi:cGMP-dependent 3',5'-cyclic phosphodiesterase
MFNLHIGLTGKLNVSHFSSPHSAMTSIIAARTINFKCNRWGIITYQINPFLQKTPLAQLYSSEGSVLERHHLAQTVCILNMDQCNILENLTPKEYQQVLDNIREIILATDIATHFKRVGKLKQMVADGFDKSRADHHYLLLCLLMNAADLSDQTKRWPLSKAVAANIYTEFFSQGDLEKAMGNRPQLMMDRERACVPQLQLDFFDTVALPIFQ